MKREEGKEEESKNMATMGVPVGKKNVTVKVLEVDSLGYGEKVKQRVEVTRFTLSLE